MKELELHLAATPFLKAGYPITPSRRQRLRAAIVALIQARGGLVMPEMIATSAEALDQLERLLRRCEEIGVPWQDVVARVNRGWTQEVVTR